jgi:hypothetical protein
MGGTEAGVEVQLYSNLTSALDGVSGERHARPAFTLGQSPGTQCAGGWEGPGSVCTGMEQRKSLVSTGFDPRAVQPVLRVTVPTNCSWDGDSRSADREMPPTFLER